MNRAAHRMPFRYLVSALFTFITSVTWSQPALPPVMPWDGVCPTVLSVPGGTIESVDACHAMEVAQQGTSLTPMLPFSDAEIGPPAYILRWSPEQMAMRQANQEALRSPRQTNEIEIRHRMERMQGNIRINGWGARRIDERLFLVVYTYTQGDQTPGWAFEVDLPAKLVRLVNGDLDLESKYGLRR